VGALALFRPARPTARQSLADAIQEAAASEAASLAAREAWARGQRQIDECAARVDQAIEAVKAAKTAQAARMASAAATAGAILATDRGLRDARARQTDAEDELEAAGLALVELDRAVEAAKARVVDAKTKGLKLAAAGVVAVEIDPTISRALALASQLETLLVSLNQERAKLQFLINKCFTIYGSSASSEKLEEMRAILNSTRQFADENVRGPVYQEWSDVLFSLETDPDVPLPV